MDQASFTYKICPLKRYVPHDSALLPVQAMTETLERGKPERTGGGN